METLPANTTAETELYAPGSLDFSAPRPSFQIGSFRFGNQATAGPEESSSAVRDQADLEAACTQEQQLDVVDGHSPSVLTNVLSQGDDNRSVAAPVPAVPRAGATGAGRAAHRVHATHSLRRKLADSAFQMGSGGDADKTFLRSMVDRLTTAGLKPPTVLVEYDQLNVEADALVGSANIPSLSNVLVGTLKVGCASVMHDMHSISIRKAR